MPPRRHKAGRPSLRRAVRLAVWLAALGLLPLAALGLFAVPQADDFCFGALWREHGLAGTVAQFYETHSGRIAANGLIAAPFALAAETGLDPVDLYAAASGLTLAAFAGFAVWSAGRIWPGLPVAGRLAVGTVLLFALVANARSVRDLVYWLPGIANYALPGLVLAGLFVWLHAALLRRTAIPPAQAGLAAPLLLAAALAHELAGGLAVLLLAASAAVRRATPGVPTQPRLHALLALTALAGFAAVYLAPGSQARADLYPGHGDIAASLVWGGLLLIEFVFRRMAYPGTLGWLLLAFLISLALARRRGRGAGEGARPLEVWYPVGVFLAAGYFVFAAGWFGQGSPVPARVQNLVYLIGVAALTATAAAAARTYGARICRWARRRRPAATPRRAGLAALALLLASPGVWHALAALDDAPALRAGTQARFDRLAEAAPDDRVTLPPLDGAPSLLLIEDLRPDPDFWINRCLADYAAVAAVSVRPGAARQ